jgi:hypothetical protein
VAAGAVEGRWSDRRGRGHPRRTDHASRGEVATARRGTRGPGIAGGGRRQLERAEPATVIAVAAAGRFIDVASSRQYRGTDQRHPR